MSDEPKPARTVEVANVLLIAVGAGMLAIACYGAVKSRSPSDAPQRADEPVDESPMGAPVQQEPQQELQQEQEQEQDAGWPQMVGDLGQDEATALCSKVIDALRSSCPAAGQPHIKDCTVIEGDSHGLEDDGPFPGRGAGDFVAIGPKAQWFVALDDGAVHPFDDAAIRMCPDMDSIFDRMRARAREAAAKRKPGDPVACSLEDIEQAQSIAGRIVELPKGHTERDLEGLFASIAKEKGVAKKSVRKTWEKVQKLCPQAL
jgi:hypothetical protein